MRRTVLEQTNAKGLKCRTYLIIKEHHTAVLDVSFPQMLEIKFSTLSKNKRVGTSLEGFYFTTCKLDGVFKC